MNLFHLLILVKEMRKIDESTFLSKVLSVSSEQGKLKYQMNSFVMIYLCLLSILLLPRLLTS